MTTLPTLNTAGWSISDYEFAYRTLSAMVGTGVAALCRSDAMNDAGNYFPGPALIYSVLNSNLDRFVEAVVTPLRSIRFDDAADDDRRVKLLLLCDLALGEMTTIEALQAALERSTKPVATAQVT